MTMKKVLIIEDDQSLGEILLQKVKSAGYEAELLQDGEEGFRRMRESIPDFVLLDLVLPTLNGFEILSQKEADHRTSMIPTIIMTNSFHPVNGTEIDKFKVTDFVVKSNIAPEQIINKINNYFKTMTTDNTQAAENKDFLSGKSILIVEDDDFLASILLTRLSSKNATVVLAKSGEDALLELKKQKIDAALLDILLPGITGFDVLKSIRETPETKEMPVTIISNFDQEKDKEKAKEMNAGFFVKALVNPDDIVAQVEAMLHI